MGPLFVVTGASGVGKTAVGDVLARRLRGCTVYDLDLIWCRTWDERNDNWLRIAHSNWQAGMHTVFCGTLLPDQVDHLPNRCLVGDILYLTLHCDDADRQRRLRARWQHRLPDGEAFIDRQRLFAAWLIANAGAFNPPMAIVDTSRRTAGDVAVDVARWVETWRSSYEQEPGVRYREMAQPGLARQA